MNSSNIVPIAAAPSVNIPALPASAAIPNLADTAAAEISLKTFSKVVAAAGLTNLLRSAGPYTVFAPTNDAFAKLPAGTLDEWMKPENRMQLISTLKYHIAPGRVCGADVGKLKEAKTVGGQFVLVKMADDKVTVDDAGITTADISSSNGVIHTIDGVLTPTRH